VIEWRLQPEDVARIRFTFSPLKELVFSLIALRAPAEHSLHLPWIRTTRSLVADLDLAEVFAIVPVHGAVADFLTPLPNDPTTDITTHLGQLRQAEPERVIADVTALASVPRTVASRIAEDPEAAVHRIADTLHEYWRRALAEPWPRILRLLEADVLWRSQRLAAGGLQALFDDLHPTVALNGDRLSAADPFDYSGDLSGTGLILVPHVMGWPRVRKMIEPYQAAISYPVRGIATLWETAPPPPPDALATLIGHTRATILINLTEPASTTTLARRLRLTPGAISQHLSVLHAARLVSRTRVTGSVLYCRTSRGDALIE
jgi:DNA-binding transcriptional ArsR family regulator